LFGIDPETDLVSNEQLEPPHTKFPFIEFMAPDKSLEIYKLQLKQSDYRVNQQRAMWYPKLSINTYWGAQQYDDNFGISFNGSDWSKISYVSLNISIPIFDGFTTKNKVDSALIEYDNSMKTFEYEKLKSKIQDELILKEFNHSKKAVDIASDNYQIAKENAGLQFQKFEQGIVSLDNYLESFDDYLTAEVVYLNLLSDVYVHYSKILSRTI
jgi:outer membrane protein TolC